jgi:predicted SAM-dependent methyltransferase
MGKQKCMLTVDVEALPKRAVSDHMNTLIYGRLGGKEYGIGKMMDIADKHNIKITFFVDFGECELYGDEIIDVGRYIVSRGHDMQVHCHYDLLDKIVGKQPWVSINENYYSWCQNEDDARVIIDYVTEQYMKCTGKVPVAYRGGEFRFGIGVLKALKENGYQADLSYNYVRPEKLPINRQFLFENGIVEFPISILPNKESFNFNSPALAPSKKNDFEMVIGKYQKLFDEFYNYYGDDAISTILMHSWSFLRQSQKSRCFDEKNDLMVMFFDYFLEAMKEKIQFISVSDAVSQIQTEKLKNVEFESIFSKESFYSKRNIIKIKDFIREKAKGRNVVIWGKGWIESVVFQTVDLHRVLNTAYYISNDADSQAKWRGKPVYKFSDISISPDKDFVLVLAQPTFPEIRDTLKNAGFREFEDYFDIQKKVPASRSSGRQTMVEYKCPICGGNAFETYNSDRPRRCSSCGSLERTRTVSKLLNENMPAGISKMKILHVSPTRSERLLFKNMNADTITVDIRPECKTDIVADICCMPDIAPESFDMAFASCVLNHVYDDNKALSEIKRVLGPGGIALIWVLESGTLKTLAHKDPTGWYGKDNYEKYRIGTFRHYGEVDFSKQLLGYFSKVQCYEKYDEVTEESCKWYWCLK